MDKDGNLCPSATNQLHFKVTGAGNFKAVANGDATCLEPFQLPHMTAFSGKLVFIVQSTEKGGTINASAETENLQTGSSSIKVQ